MPAHLGVVQVPLVPAAPAAVLEVAEAVLLQLAGLAALHCAVDLFLLAEQAQVHHEELLALGLEPQVGARFQLGHGAVALGALLQAGLLQMALLQLAMTSLAAAVRLRLHRAFRRGTLRERAGESAAPEGVLSAQRI